MPATLIPPLVNQVVVPWTPEAAFRRFTWHPGEAPGIAQEVELRFTPEGAGTRLTLTDSGWEAMGPKGRRASRAYRLGWAYVLSPYLGRRGPLVLTLNVIGGIVLLLASRSRRRPAEAAGS